MCSKLHECEAVDKTVTRRKDKRKHTYKTKAKITKGTQARTSPIFSLKGCWLSKQLSKTIHCSFM